MGLCPSVCFRGAAAGKGESARVSLPIKDDVEVSGASSEEGPLSRRHHPRKVSSRGSPQSKITSPPQRDAEPGAEKGLRATGSEPGSREKDIGVQVPTSSGKHSPRITTASDWAAEANRDSRRSGKGSMGEDRGFSSAGGAAGTSAARRIFKSVSDRVMGGAARRRRREALFGRIMAEVMALANLISDTELALARLGERRAAVRKECDDIAASRLRTLGPAGSHGSAAGGAPGDSGPNPRSMRARGPPDRGGPSRLAESARSMDPKPEEGPKDVPTAGAAGGDEESVEGAAGGEVRQERVVDVRSGDSGVPAPSHAESWSFEGWNAMLERTRDSAAPAASAIPRLAPLAEDDELSPAPVRKDRGNRLLESIRAAGASDDDSAGDATLNSSEWVHLHRFYSSHGFAGVHSAEYHALGGLPEVPEMEMAAVDASNARGHTGGGGGGGNGGSGEIATAPTIHVGGRGGEQAPIAATASAALDSATSGLVSNPSSSLLVGAGSGAGAGAGAQMHAVGIPGAAMRAAAASSHAGMSTMSEVTSVGMTGEIAGMVWEFFNSSRHGSMRTSAATNSQRSGALSNYQSGAMGSASGGNNSGKSAPAGHSDGEIIPDASRSSRPRVTAAQSLVMNSPPDVTSDGPPPVKGVEHVSLSDSDRRHAGGRRERGRPVSLPTSMSRGEGERERGGEEGEPDEELRDGDSAVEVQGGGAEGQALLVRGSAVGTGKGSSGEKEGAKEGRGAARDTFDTAAQVSALAEEARQMRRVETDQQALRQTVAEQLKQRLALKQRELAAIALDTSTLSHRLSAYRLAYEAAYSFALLAEPGASRPMSRKASRIRLDSKASAESSTNGAGPGTSSLRGMPAVRSLSRAGRSRVAPGAAPHSEHAGSSGRSRKGSGSGRSGGMAGGSERLSANESRNAGEEESRETVTPATSRHSGGAPQGSHGGAHVLLESEAVGVAKRRDDCVEELRRMFEELVRLSTAGQRPHVTYSIGLDRVHHLLSALTTTEDDEEILEVSRKLAQEIAASAGDGGG